VSTGQQCPLWVISVVSDAIRHVRFTPNSDRLLRCREMTPKKSFVSRENSERAKAAWAKRKRR
jgi:hypothetical protein